MEEVQANDLMPTACRFWASGLLCDGTERTADQVLSLLGFEISQ